MTVRNTTENLPPPQPPEPRELLAALDGVLGFALSLASLDHDLDDHRYLEGVRVAALLRASIGHGR